VAELAVWLVRTAPRNQPYRRASLVALASLFGVAASSRSGPLQLPDAFLPVSPIFAVAVALLFMAARPNDEDAGRLLSGLSFLGVLLLGGTTIGFAKPYLMALVLRSPTPRVPLVRGFQLSSRDGCLARQAQPQRRDRDRNDTRRGLCRDGRGARRHLAGGRRAGGQRGQ